MITNIQPLENGQHQIDIDYADEGIELDGHTTIIGDYEHARAYAEIFDRDLRNTYSHLFPVAEPDPEHLTEEA